MIVADKNARYHALEWYRNVQPREMDELIAARVLMYERIPSGGGLWGPKGGAKFELPSYSADLEAAWDMAMELAIAPPQDTDRSSIYLDLFTRPGGFEAVSTWFAEEETFEAYQFISGLRPDRAALAMVCVTLQAALGAYDSTKVWL